MPFTFAHPAIVLPFGKLSRRLIPMAGLVVGSMIPDFEYFLRMRVESIYSHTLPGLLWFDLPLGVLITCIYLLFVKRTLIQHLPTPLNQRFSAYEGTKINLIAIAVSVLIGAATHLLWDGFTHPSGYFVLHISALTKQYHTVYIYKILQHTSTILGLLFIMYVIYTLPKGKTTKRSQEKIASYWLLIAIVTILVTITRVAIGFTNLHLGDIVVTIISGFFIALITASLSKLSHPKE
jgi:hypothetical protein